MNADHHFRPEMVIFQPYFFVMQKSTPTFAA